MTWILGTKRNSKGSITTLSVVFTFIQNKTANLVLLSIKVTSEWASQIYSFTTAKYGNSLRARIIFKGSPKI
jgi:hypothetical protein